MNVIAMLIVGIVLLIIAWRVPNQPPPLKVLEDVIGLILVVVAVILIVLALVGVPVPVSTGFR